MSLFFQCVPNVVENPMSPGKNHRTTQGLGDPRLSGPKDVNIAFLYGHFGITSTFSSDYGHVGII